MFKIVKNLFLIGFVVAVVTGKAAAELVSVPYREALHHQPQSFEPAAQQSVESHGFSFNMPSSEEKKAHLYGELYNPDADRQEFEQMILNFTQEIPTSRFLPWKNLLGLNLSFARGSNAYSRKEQMNLAIYSEYQLAPQIVSQLISRLNFAIVYDYTRKKYLDRTLAGEDSMSPATATPERTYGTSHTISYTVRYPVLSRLNVLVQGTYQKQKNINNSLEHSTQQTVSSQRYFAGISWEY